MNSSALKAAIERRHGGVASLVQTVPVRAHLMGAVRENRYAELQRARQAG